MLDALGIDFSREVEVFHYCRLPSGRHSHGGWFHAAGRITAGRESQREVAPGSYVLDLEVLSPQLSVGLSSRSDLVREPFRDLPLIQLDLQAELPWLISDPEPE